MLPQPPWVFSIRGLRLYFPTLEPWVMRSASLPVRPGLSVQECVAAGCYLPSACLVLRHSESGPLGLSVCEHGALGSASALTACTVCPTLRQSQSHHSNESPLHPSCLSPPLLLVWMNVYFLSPWRRTSLPFNFLPVLVV